MEDLTPRRGRKPRTAREVVTNLFPENRVEVTPERARYYGQLGAYGFYLDRQSDKQVLADAERTGQEARVAEIEEAAAQLGLHCPAPVENAAWASGVGLQYQVDERLWFFDGTDRNASGYIISVHTRPRLWLAFHLAVRLGEQGIGPRWFIVGEATRFFREARWLQMFTEGLQARGIKLYVCGFGQVTEDEGHPCRVQEYVNFVTAQSGKLAKACEKARRAKRRRGQLFWRKRLTYGVSTDAEGRVVFADPEEYPALAEAVIGLGTGRFPTALAASAWLAETPGAPKTDTWLRETLREPDWILDGIYRAYRKKSRLCLLEDPSGVLTDISTTERGNRRYLVQMDEGERFPIDFERYGVTPIPAEMVAAARQRVLHRRGRPSPVDGFSGPRRSQVLLPTRMVRCAVCGAAVHELHSAAVERTGLWTLHCTCVLRVVQREHLSGAAAARARCAADHCIQRHGALSPAVWDGFVAWLAQHPVAGEEPAPEPLAARAALETRRRVLQTELDEQIDRALGFGLDTQSEPVRLSLQRHATRLGDEIARLDRELRELSAQTLLLHRRDQTLRYWQSVTERYLRHGAPDLATRRQCLARVLERVEVDLATGQWTAVVNTREGGSFQGEVDNRTLSGWGSVIHLSFQGQVPPLGRAA